MSPRDRAVEINDSDEAFDLMKDLESQTSDEVRRQRSNQRLTLKAAVIIQPGNATDAFKLKAQGVLGDISTGGCRVMSPIPLHVGDIYRLRFESDELDLPLTFARCLRCRLVHDDAFETGLTFFQPVDLSVRPDKRRNGSAAEPRNESLL
jgi:hypothetical protein